MIKSETGLKDRKSQEAFLRQAIFHLRASAVSQALYLLALKPAKNRSRHTMNMLVMCGCWAWVLGRIQRGDISPWESMWRCLLLIPLHQDKHKLSRYTYRLSMSASIRWITVGSVLTHCLTIIVLFCFGLNYEVILGCKGALLISFSAVFPFCSWLFKGRHFALSWICN